MVDTSMFDNFNGYYLGWAVLILVLLWILVCSGYLYVDHGKGHGKGHGEGYGEGHGDGEMSMSPGRAYGYGRGYHHRGYHRHH
uniref:Transmembrane protein n=1 Tax=Pithovirus LCPAC304 TaxID=2506594 RepID=A0A481ZAN4_9VIRU|nr:MAG: hypothetical protein LCPAC304_05770 [Pithovirus LCPAC304]